MKFNYLCNRRLSINNAEFEEQIQDETILNERIVDSLNKVNIKVILPRYFGLPSMVFVLNEQAVE